MRYLKIFSLAAVAAATLAAILGVRSASATVLCSTTADPCPSAQKWLGSTVLGISIPVGGGQTDRTSGETTIESCSGSTIRGRSPIPVARPPHLHARR